MFCFQVENGVELIGKTKLVIRLEGTNKEKGCRLIGPNSFGVISPGKAKAGFMAHRIFMPGNIGIMSRSAINCCETVFFMKQKGIGPMPNSA